MADHYPLYDAQRSADALIDGTESQSDQYKYRAFGLQVNADPGPTENPFQYVGKQGYYRDPELELYLLGGSSGGRYYDPAAGRFLSEDPLGFSAGDDNLYRYVRNNPVTETDPSGREISEYNRFEDGKQILTVFKDHQPLGSVIFDPKDKRAREAAEFLAKEKEIQGKQFDSIDIASSIAVILFRKQHPCDSQAAMVDALTKKDIEEFENRIAEAKISLKLLRQVPGAGRLAGAVEGAIDAAVGPVANQQIEQLMRQQVAQALQQLGFAQVVPQQGKQNQWEWAFVIGIGVTFSVHLGGDAGDEQSNEERPEEEAKAESGAEAVAPRSLLHENPSGLVKSRVGELTTAISDGSKGRITMGVAVVEDANGVRSVLVSTSEPRGYLRPDVTLKPGETMVVGTGHAEADLVAYAKANNLKIVDVGATRPVCVPCQDALGPTGANISTPLKKRPQ